VLLSGALVDRGLRAAMVGGCVIVTLALLGLDLVQGSLIVTVIATAAWGLAFTALPSPGRPRSCAPSRPSPTGPRPSTSSAFQGGIGGGALLGAVLLGAGEIPPVLTAAMLFATLGTLLAAVLTGPAPRPAAAHPWSVGRAVVGRALRL
jgi:predicted MFS family arabinose efflux permease